MEFNTKIEQFDIKEIVNSKYLNWDKFKNSTVLITGATGLIGSTITKSLIFVNEVFKTNIKILALVRNKKKACKIFPKGVNFIVQDISEPLRINQKVDYIIHTANSTSSRGFVEQPVETINSIVQGTKNILEFAKNKKIKSLVYLSSMEVFGKTDFTKEEALKENDYGYIDISEVRSSYPEGKRLAENMCVAYAKEYSVPVKVARLVQTIGASVDYFDNRVFAQFARNVVERKDIILHTTGESIRSYCYITDAVIGILVLLERGKDGEFYNVANEETTCSIKQMAEMLCNKYTSSKLRFELDDKLYPPASKLKVDTSLLKELNWKPSVNLEEMFNRLVQDFYLRPKPLIKKASAKKKFIKKYIFDKTRLLNFTEYKVLGLNFKQKNRLKFAEIFKNTKIQNNKIVLIDNHGGGYCGNLKYIAEELLRASKDYNIVWLDKLTNRVINNFPQSIRRIEIHTEEAAKELASAKVWISTQRLSEFLKDGLIKKEGQYYIQVWHGSLGIKKIGFDLHPQTEVPWMSLAKKDAEMIDYLISNSDFETNVYRGNFWAQGEAKLFGHPRNDIFFKDNFEIIKKVKNQLNITEDKKIILYAPTFRENKDLSCYNMDYKSVVNEIEKKFGTNCVLVLRFHPWALKRCEHLFGENPNIINGNKYDDIQELMIASDYVITDYSSCVFDFMLSRKPAFIYATDIEKYNTERGFYYSLETTPFPVAKNNEALMNNILNFDNEKYQKAVEEFLQEKGCVEDGLASERVARLVGEIRYGC